MTAFWTSIDLVFVSAMVKAKVPIETVLHKQNLSDIFILTKKGG